MKSRFTLAVLFTALVVFWFLMRPEVERPASGVGSITKSGSPDAASVAMLKLPAAPKLAAPAITAFREWSGRFLAANAAERPSMIELGQAHAKAHTMEIAKLIKLDPQAAIANAVPMVIRQKLPQEIVALLEERPRLRGDYEVYGNVPLPGAAGTMDPYSRTVTGKDGKRWNAYVYGGRLWQRTMTNVSLNGVAVAKDMAVSDSPVRVLEVGELPVKDGREVVESCPISGIETKVEMSPAGAPPPVEEETPAFETPERIIYVCSGGHISQMSEQYLSEEEKAYWASLGTDLNSGAGSGPAHGPVGTIPSSWTTGNRTFLYIRCAFPDNPVDPQNEQECYDMLKAMNDYIVQTSYGRCYFTYAVPPLVILPYPLAWYNRYDTDVGGGDYAIQNHARQIARSMGYNYTSFDLDAVRWNGGPGSYGGSASVGARGMRMKTSSAGTFCHELGHNLGVWHANFWRTTPPSFTGPGNNLEYGNLFDLMGSSGGMGQYTASFKNTLSWMPQEQFWNATTSGLYRISQTDDGIADPSRRYALRIRRDAERDYWAEFRLGHASNVGITNGLMMTWDQWGLGGIGGSGGAPLNGSNRGAQLLDMTPGSFGNGITDTRNDSALWVGRTYSDPDFNIHITPIAKNSGTTPPSMDVQVQIGDTPGNSAPVLSISSSATSVAVGASVTLTASASDPNGDPLAYAWVFGDGNYSLNNSAVQTKSWSSTGHYRVLCTASDMKGKRTTRSVLITVGTPTTFTASGNITGTDSLPLEGVYVANYAPSNNTSHTNSSTFRGTWTDSDGNYVITGLSAGSYTITPNLYPLTFTPAGFTNPVAVGPNATAKNFTSAILPAITISYPDGTANEAAVPGTATIRLNREGATTAAISVQIYNANTGSATRNTDYTLTPTPAAATSPDGGSGTSEYVIPVGASFLDITVTPVNDYTAEGVEYASLDFVNTASGYIMAGNPRAVVPIIDDESSLPVVKITPVDDSGHEAGADTLTMKLERNGSTAAALSVSLSYSGTATNVTDYAAPASVSIPVGSASTTFTITPVNDTDIETTETLITTIATNAAYLRDSTAQAVTSILNDDDMPIVTLAVTDAAANETGADKGVFTITRTGGNATTLTVDYSVNGRAVLGTDYRRLDGRAVIPAGSASVTVEIVPFDDALDEGTQDVILQLRTAQNYVIGGTGAGTVTIADNDASQLYVELNTATGVEPASTSANGPVFQITRPASGTAITVNYSITGTATSGSDFTALPGSIAFATTDTSRTITVSMLADSNFENAETVTLTLLPGTGYTLMESQQSSMTAFIYDGDQAVVDVNVADSTSALTVPFTETTSAGEDFLISRRVSTASDLVVSYTISGTATSGADFTVLSGTATIPANSTSVLVTVIPVNDTIPEGVETITMTITPLSGTYGVRFGSATMLLGDSDVFASGSVGFGAATASTTEDIGSYNVPVNITGTPPGAVSVYYRVSGGTAAGNGIDFTLAQGVLNFAVGETTKNIPILIKHDVMPEPAETISLQLLNPIGANLGTNGHTLTINNVSMPEAFSDPASGVTPSSMTFNGRVMPGGLATTYWFEYGGTTGYGIVTPTQNLAAGSNSVNVNAAVTGLVLTSYHFRLVAQNSLGTTYGIDQFPGIISEPPLIIEHPQDLNVNLGDSAEFTVFASGGGLSYQWQKGITDIPGATTSIYTIPVTTLASAGTYRCVVTNTDGTATSNAATLVVVTAPMITQHPSSQTVDATQDATMTVTASGFFLTYQWQKDQVDVPNKTESTLILTNTSVFDSGSYRCVVTNSAGSATSNAATLGINAAPGITQHPASQTVNLGQPATFNLGAVGPNLSYQWQKGTDDIPGANSASYTIDPTTLLSAGSYRCRVSNSLGTVFSNPATLFINPPPTILVPTQPATITANLGQSIVMAVSASGVALSFQWSKNGVDLLGAQQTSLTIPSVAGSHAGSYICHVVNPAGEAFSPAFTLQVIEPPVINVQPVNVTVDAGQPATFQITVTGIQLTYQWLRNAVPIPGASSSSYTINAVTGAQVGAYTCQVANSAGNVLSAKALLAITGMPVITREPFSVIAEAGAPVEMSLEASGENLTFAWKKNTSTVSTQRVWTPGLMTSALGGPYVAQVSNALNSISAPPAYISLTTVLGPAVEAPNLKWSTTGHGFWLPGTASQSHDGIDMLVTGPIIHSQKAMLTTRMTGPLTLRWWQKLSTEAGKDIFRVMVDGVESYTASGEIDWQPMSLPIADGLHSVEFSYTKDDSGSTGLDRVWIDNVIPGPVYEVMGGGGHHLLTVGSNLTLNVAVTGIGTPDVYQWRRNATNISGAKSPQLILTALTAAKAGAYDCAVTETINGAKTVFAGDPIQVGIVTVIDKTCTIKAGTKTNLVATAAGNGLSYQWRKVTPLETTILAGETSSTFALTSLLPADSADYICEVSNPGGQIDAGINKVIIFDSAPIINHAGDLPPAILSGPYDYQVPYNPDPAFTPTAFTISGQPAGLVIDKVTGRITGTPNVSRAEPYEVIITASNSAGKATLKTRITVLGLGGKTGLFVGMLPRQPVLNENLGGRFDLNVTATGAFTGSLTLALNKYSFSGRLVTAVNLPAQATANVQVQRGKLTPLTLQFTLTDGELLTNGSVTSGAEALSFTGWRNPWTSKDPANVFMGISAPPGLYTFGLKLPAPLIGVAATPQGTGYGSFTLNKTTGMTTIAGRLADDTAYTAAASMGRQGQLILFTTLYSAAARGSIVGQPKINLTLTQENHTLTGSVSWLLPPLAKPRIYEDGMTQPIDLTVEGGRYISPVAPDLVLGLVNGGANAATLAFTHGGIGLPPPLPDLAITLGVGNSVNYPVSNQRNTSLSFVTDKGAVTGTFSLEDNDPLDLRPPSTVLRKLTRKVTYQGLLIRGATGWKGVGYFMLPKLPAVTGETISNTDVLSGSVLLQPTPVP